MKYFSLKVVLSWWIVTSHRSPTTALMVTFHNMTVPRAEDPTYIKT